MMNSRWIGKLHVQSENRRELRGSQNKFWEQLLFSDFLLLIVNLRPFEKFQRTWFLLKSSKGPKTVKKVLNHGFLPLRRPFLRGGQRTQHGARASQTKIESKTSMIMLLLKLTRPDARPKIEYWSLINLSFRGTGTGRRRQKRMATCWRQTKAQQPKQNLEEKNRREQIWQSETIMAHCTEL